VQFCLIEYIAERKAARGLSKPDIPYIYRKAGREIIIFFSETTEKYCLFLIDP
jgi:hypothetical protein